MYNIAILASGSGTNAENIVRTFNEGTLLRVRVCLTDHADAGVIERMNRLGVDTIYVEGAVWRKEPQKVIDILRDCNIDLIVLAGFMRLLNPAIVETFRGRILNLHPSLLPKYGGKGMWGHHVHEAVIAAGETESGVTVHYVNEEYDRGEILMQERVEILPGETAESLEAKIHEAEYRLYPIAISEALRRMGKLPPPLPQTGIPGVEAPLGEAPLGEKPAPQEATVEVEQEAAPAAEIAPDTCNTDEEWADTLNIKYDPSAVSHGNPGPGVLPPGPQMPPQAPMGGGMPSPAEPMPPTYMVISVIATLLCCLIPGIVAIFFSAKVSSAYYSGDLEGARRASRNAEIWIIVSFCLGVLSNTLSLPMMILQSALGL